MDMLELGRDFRTEFYPRESNKYLFETRYHGDNSQCKHKTNTKGSTP